VTSKRQLRRPFKKKPKKAVATRLWLWTRVLMRMLE